MASKANREKRNAGLSGALFPSTRAANRANQNGTTNDVHPALFFFFTGDTARTPTPLRVPSGRIKGFFILARCFTFFFLFLTLRGGAQRGDPLVHYILRLAYSCTGLSGVKVTVGALYSGVKPQ